MPLASKALQRIIVSGDDTIIEGARVLANNYIGTIAGAIMSDGFEVQAASTLVGGLVIDEIIVTIRLEIAALELADGAAAPVSNPGQAAIRYNPGTNMIQFSKNGGAWTDWV